MILSSLGMGHASSIRTRADLREGSGWEPSSSADCFWWTVPMLHYGTGQQLAKESRASQLCFLEPGY